MRKSERKVTKTTPQQDIPVCALMDRLRSVATLGVVPVADATGTPAAGDDSGADMIFLKFLKCFFQEKLSCALCARMPNQTKLAPMGIRGLLSRLRKHFKSVGASNLRVRTLSYLFVNYCYVVCPGARIPEFCAGSPAQLCSIR